MPITVVCQCGSRFRAPDEYAGRPARCPKCKAPLRVPEQADQPAPVKETQQGVGAKVRRVLHHLNRALARPLWSPGNLGSDRPPARPKPILKAISSLVLFVAFLVAFVVGCRIAWLNLPHWQAIALMVGVPLIINSIGYWIEREKRDRAAYEFHRRALDKLDKLDTVDETETKEPRKP